MSIHYAMYDIRTFLFNIIIIFTCFRSLFTNEALATNSLQYDHYTGMQYPDSTVSKATVSGLGDQT
jgi:hypothetical protein